MSWIIVMISICRLLLCPDGVDTKGYLNMYFERNVKVLNRLKPACGFTLIEAMISVALLALLAVGISAPYISGFQALNVQADRMLLDSRLCSRMERLVGTDFSSLASGSEVITVRGQDYTITWTVGNVDLNGDLTPEPNAWRITTSIFELPDRLLTTIVVDHEGRVGKIS